MVLTAVLTPAEEGGFVAFNPETGTTTQGETVPEAISNLREATELYLEEFPLEQTGQALLTTFCVAGNAYVAAHFRRGSSAGLATARLFRRATTRQSYRHAA